MNTLFASLMTLTLISMYGCPILLLVVWILRIKKEQGRAFRFRLGWISLALASSAWVVFYGGMFFAPDFYTPMFATWYRHWLIANCCVSVAALLTGLVGTGKMQWVVLISSITTPLACILQGVLE